MKARTSERIPVSITRRAAPGCSAVSRPPGLRARRGGFTLIELVVVVGMIGLLAMMLASGLAHTGPNVRAIQCLSNLTQMQAGANMYPADFSDTLLPNAPVGSVDTAGKPVGWCPSHGESWSSVLDNTNASGYINFGLAPYIQNQIRLYKCPGDTIPSDNGSRIRSYSMNGQVLGGLPSNITRIFQNYNPSWKMYTKVTDLGGSLPPAKAFIFCEESMFTLNDGYLQLGLSTPTWLDLPGSYHNGALGISFADGHVELHQWVSPYVQVPVTYGSASHGSQIPSSGLDADWRWIRDHASATQ